MTTGIDNQPAELIAFLTNINVDDSSKIITNELDSKISFISKYYTPNIVVESASSKTLDLIKSSDNTWMNNFNSLDENSITYQVETLNININYPDLYTVFQSVILDAFSIAYAENYDNSLYLQMDDSDLSELIINIEYLIDALESLDDGNDYSTLITQLTELESDMSSVKTGLQSIQDSVNNTSDTI